MPRAIQNILSREQRRIEVAKLLLDGHTLAEIGRAVGCGKATVHRDKVLILLAWQHEQAMTFREYVAREMRLLDEMLKVVMPKARAGNMLAVDRVLLIHTSKQKLLGVDAALLRERAREAERDAERARNPGPALEHDPIRELEDLFAARAAGPDRAGPDPGDDPGGPVN